MASSTPSPRHASHVLGITALRRKLGYGDSSLPRYKAFCDDTRAFTKKFRTSSGVAGTSLRNWKLDRDALGGMATAYLDKEGLCFWPDNETDPNYNEYQQSKHRG